MLENNHGINMSAFGRSNHIGVYAVYSEEAKCHKPNIEIFFKVTMCNKHLDGKTGNSG